MLARSIVEHELFNIEANYARHGWDMQYFIVKFVGTMPWWRPGRHSVAASGWEGVVLTRRAAGRPKVSCDWLGRFIRSGGGSARGH